MPRRLIVGARVSGPGDVYALARVRGGHVRCPMLRSGEWATCGLHLPDQGELDVSVLSDQDTHIRAVHVRVTDAQ